jgi:polygalacturonase
VDNLTIADLRIDTIRDGMNIDCRHNVHIPNCSVNSPWDDAICLKSAFALRYAHATENVTISDCYVTGGTRLARGWTEHGGALALTPPGGGTNRPGESNSAPNPTADLGTSQ